MKKKYSSCRNVCGCKVSWGLADVHWGVFSQPGCTGDTAASIQKRICSSWPAWALPAPAQAHLVGKAGQDRHPRWKGHRISWKCLLVFHSHKGSLSNYVIINIGGGWQLKIPEMSPSLYLCLPKFVKLILPTSYAAVRGHSVGGQALGRSLPPGSSAPVSSTLW